MPYSRPQKIPPEFAEPLAHAADRLGPFAREILWYADVPSTNDLVATLGERGAPEGAVVVANAQSAGRGRHGRTWVSPPGAGLYVSTLLRPLPSAVPLVTIAAGVAVAEGIQAATGLVAHVKWPNDLYIAERKVGGVLAEANSSVAASTSGVGAGRHIEFIVLGFGINVMPGAYPPDIAARATSIEGELGRASDRGLLLTECLCCLAARYADLQRGRSDTVVTAWRARAASTLGRVVRWDAAGAQLEGVAENIDDSGALVVRTDTGLSRVMSGEVRWL